MRRVHEADDAVIDAYRHLSLQVGEFIFVAELFDLRCGCRRFRTRRESRARRPGIRDEDPAKSVGLLTGKAAGIDPSTLHGLVGSERREELASATDSLD